MIAIFRKLRQDSLTKASRYVLYAVGEIILVVIGILIALQINNNNDRIKEKEKERLYLTNLRKDLVLNIREIDKYITDRTICIESAKTILEHFEGKPITDVAAFNNLCMPIYNWQRFYQVDNTFQELISSGNLTLISSDTIKTLLFNMESQYKVNKAEEDHFRFDAEVLIYQPLYELMDLKLMVESIGVQVGRKPLIMRPLPPSLFNAYLRNIKLKNGFTSAVFEFTVLNDHLIRMKQISGQLIQAIDLELKKSQS